ncbi:MAG: hypothetical protein DRG37_08050, partial [Deltaproteobacteria bacterium]
MTDKKIVSIVKGERPFTAHKVDDMVIKAVELAGGLSRKIRPGDNVVIKPNLFAPYPPPVSVDRKVIASVVRLAKELGADKVTVIDGVSVGTLMKRINLY